MSRYTWPAAEYVFDTPTLYFFHGFQHHRPAGHWGMQQHAVSTPGRVTRGDRCCAPCFLETHEGLGVI